jgi:hypothetical protein
VSFECPCGCALQLDVEQLRELAWILAWSADENHNAKISVSPPSESVRQRPEPTEVVMCRSCGAQFDLVDWIAQWCHKYRIPTPFCDRCRGGS